MTYSMRQIKIALATLVITSIGSIQCCNSSTSSTICVESCDPDPCCSCKNGHFFVDANLLYLRAIEGGLSSWCDSTDINNANENDIVISRLKGKAHDPKFKWNLGFRLGGGYKFADSNCGIGVYWTHYNSHTHGDKSHRNEHKWKINFDVVDILYGCKFDLSNCFVLTPFGGLRYAKIDQKLRTNFINTITDIEGSTPSSSFSNISSLKGSVNEVLTKSKGNIKEEFSGIGPLIGVEGSWDIKCGFSLYGNISVSLLYGIFHVRSKQADVFETGKNINHLRKHIEACQAVVDAGFGIRWKTCFCNDRFLILQLGLEQHQYFNHNRFCNYGDLSLNGVALSISHEY